MRSVGPHARNPDQVTRNEASFDGRLLMLAAIGSYLTAVAVARVAWGVDLWRWFGVPSVHPIFFDARNITSAIACHAQGLDPLVENPCDLAARPMNYPRVWLALRWLGLDDQTVIVFGAALLVAFVWAVWVLVGRLRPREGLLVAAAMCSPAVMFAVERGQSDLVAFVLVVVAVLAWRTGADTWRTLSPLAVLAAAILKLFPVVALGAFLLARHTRAAVTATVSGVVFVVYAIATLPDLRAIADVLPQGQHQAYGVRILPAVVYHRYVADAWYGGDTVRQALAVILLVGVASVAWWLASRRLALPEPTDPRDPVEWRELALHSGGLIYVGTFATANNWDYRLIFLLLILPWALHQAPSVAFARFALGTVVVQLYIGGILTQRSLADEIVSWTVAALLAMLLIVATRSALSWMRQTVAVGLFR